MQKLFEACIGPCMICRRQHINMGYSPHPRQPVLWTCEDCIPIARKVYRMPDAMFTAYETYARQLAGEAAGAYLDSIDKTDLAALTKEEWASFIETVVTGFSGNIRGAIEIGDMGVPF